MAGAVGSIEDDPGIAVFQADAFGLVFQVVEVPGEDDAFVLEVDQVEQEVVTRNRPAPRCSISTFRSG